MSENNMTEMNKLVVLLAKAGVPFEINAFDFLGKPTFQICCPSIKEKKVDAICHEGSYGHHDGLIEIMSDYEIDVIGWLTAEEAFKYFQIF